MRWQFFALVLVGLIAAVAAAVLVASLKTGPLTLREAPAPSAPQDVDVVVASKPLARMTTVSEDMVTVKKVPAGHVPAGAFRSPVEVAGQILVAPVVAGQPLTKSSFAAAGPGVYLAATLAPGMRAMTVSLSDYSGMEGLLYPGCAVDVLASFDLRGKGEQEAGIISATILNNVQVLAIEDRTAVSGERTEGSASRSGPRRRVTLMVSPAQAEELQLAMEHGVISLALRNPQDAGGAEGPHMTSLTDMGPPPPARPGDRPAGPAPARGEDPKRVPAYWTTVLLKGGESSTVSFPPEEGQKRPAPK
jgi:pilus assembly protein CpaB